MKWKRLARISGETQSRAQIRMCPYPLQVKSQGVRMRLPARDGRKCAQTQHNTIMDAYFAMVWGCELQLLAKTGKNQQEPPPLTRIRLVLELIWDK